MKINSTFLEESLASDSLGSASTNKTTTIINIAKNGLGVVSLFTAAALHQGGLVLGGFTLVLAAVLSATSFYFIASCCAETHSTTYKEIFQHSFGQRFGWIVSVIIGAFTFNICLLYMLVLGLFSKYAFRKLHILDFCNGSDAYENAASVAIIALTSAIPLSFFNKLSCFKYTSLFGICSLVFVGVVHFIACVSGNILFTSDESTPLFPRNATNVISFLATISSAFNCHFNAANFFHESGGNLRDFKHSIVQSFAIMLIVNVFVGFSAYVSLGSWLEDNAPCVLGFLMLETPAWLNVLGTVAAFAISLNIAFGFGMVLFPIRLAVSQILDPTHDGRDLPRKRHVLITTLLCVCIGILAAILMAFTKANGTQIVVLVLDIATSCFGVHVAFTLPGLMFYKLKLKNKNRTRLQLFSCVCITVFGMCASLLGIAKVIKSLV